MCVERLQNEHLFGGLTKNDNRRNSLQKSAVTVKQNHYVKAKKSHFNGTFPNSLKS